MRRRWVVAGAAAFLLLVGVLAVLAAKPGLRVPLAPDAPEYARFAPGADAGEAAGVALEVVVLQTGRATAPRCGPAGEASCFERTGILHAAFLVKHPQATFLIEASLSARGEEDLASYPFLHRQALDYEPIQGLGAALAASGVTALDFVVLTHTHWDHTSGLVDLPSPRVVLGAGETGFMASRPKDGAPIVMPHHLRNAQIEEVQWSGPPVENFPASRDWFGDGSVILVPLPGHTPGSLGVLLNHVRGKRVLFVGDAAWTMDAIELPSHKLRPVSQVTDHQPDLLAQTLWRLHHLRERRPELLLVPSHDERAIEVLRGLRRE